jgi:polyisoprenoid-binding protein YceI
VVLVYRAGALAKAGHNHLMASHDLAGTFYVPGDVLRTTFEVRLPVGGLTIDEASLRAKEGGEFTAEVPDSAREGTRRNMLGEALLDVERFAQIVVRCERLEARSAGEIEAHVQIEVRGAAHPIVIPVHYVLSADALTVSGELPLRQSDLGLTPFSALLGALQVQDEMRVRFRIVAHPGPVSSG